jgi:hypothetical protein
MGIPVAVGRQVVCLSGDTRAEVDEFDTEIDVFPSRSHDVDDVVGRGAFVEPDRGRGRGMALW